MKWLKTAVVTLLLAGVSLVGALATSADSGPRTLDYLLGTGLLCDLDPSACPVIAMAPNGDTVEITGAGTMSIHPNSATGGGTFTHKNPDGDVIGAGTWTAVDLLSFHSYGSGAVQGLPPEFEGGKAAVLVVLDPGAPGGPTFEATLHVFCLLGDHIPAGAEEGIRLNIHGAINFNQEVSGFTVFID